VTCSASAHDPDGDPLQYSWYFGDDTGITTTKQTVTHTFKYALDAVVRVDVIDARGGGYPVIAQQVVNVRGTTRPPLQSRVDQHKSYGHGEARPDGGPPGTLFRFRVFPRTSPIGAKPVLYRWLFDECRQHFDPRDPNRLPAEADCASPLVSSPEYARRFNLSGEYMAYSEVTYDDGEVEIVPVASVVVGMREHVWYSDNSGYDRWGESVPSTVTDPDAYKPVIGPPTPPTAQQQQPPPTPNQ